MRKGSGKGTQAGWGEETKQVPRNGVKGHRTKQAAAEGEPWAGRRLVRFKCWGNLGQGAGETERLFAGLKRNKLRISLFICRDWGGKAGKAREGGKE